MKKQAVITLKKKTEQMKEKVLIEIRNNKINYIEQNTTNVLFDQNSYILIRENKEMYMELFFKEQKAIIYIKSLKNNLEVVLKTKKIDITKNRIVIQYEMENEEYLYKIEMED